MDTLFDCTNTPHGSVELVLQLIARIVFTVLVVWFVEPPPLPSKILATALENTTWTTYTVNKKGTLMCIKPLEMAKICHKLPT